LTVYSSYSSLTSLNDLIINGRKTMKVIKVRTEENK